MLTLLIDADDTLWENNIHYDACIRDFADLMGEQGFDPGEAEDVMEAVERERIPLVGYAPEEFGRSLVITYERLCARHSEPVRRDVARAILEIGNRVISYPIELLDGVEQTLSWLSRRYQLLLVTKGDEEVQEDKLTRSGLRGFFDAVHVVPEKDVTVFRSLVEEYALCPEQTWMVGNSPRSDINPAVEAGVGAIYLPHPDTWGMEIEELSASDRVVVLDRFHELREFFSDDAEGGRS